MGCVRGERSPSSPPLRDEDTGLPLAWRRGGRLAFGSGLRCGHPWPLSRGQQAVRRLSGKSLYLLGGLWRWKATRGGWPAEATWGRACVADGKLRAACW